MKNLIVILLFPLIAFGQKMSIKNDTITIVFKLIITDKKVFLKDTVYSCGKEIKIRKTNDTLYYYAKHQYLKMKISNL